VKRKITSPRRESNPRTPIILDKPHILFRKLFKLNSSLDIISMMKQRTVGCTGLYFAWGISDTRT